MKPSTVSFLAATLLLSAHSSAFTFECNHIRYQGKKYNFSKIGGPHSVSYIDEDHPPSIHNYTFTVDLCGTLKKEKGVKSEEQCDSGTYGMSLVGLYS
jgi:autophagy-related protein 27